MQVNGKNPATNLLDTAAALNITVLRVFATGTVPELLPLQVSEGEGWVGSGGRAGGERGGSVGRERFMRGISGALHTASWLLPAAAYGLRVSPIASGGG